MTWLVGQTILWLLTAIVAGGVTFVMLAVITKILRGRTHELATAKDALVKYEQAFDKVMDDPATPASARDLLLQFDRGVMHKKSAYSIATSVFRNRSDWLRKDGEEPQVIREMREVGRHRPDLYEAFTSAIACGFVATMLRWFFPARALTFLIMDPRLDPITPARAVACAADHDNHDPLPQAA